MTGLQKFNQTITNPKTQQYLQQILGEKKSSFISNLTALVASSTQLQECDPLGLMYSAIKATALDLPLDPNLGFAYVIPFKDNKLGITNAQFQIGYKGFIQLAIRSGQFKTINVRDVRDGEIIDEDFISGEIKFKKIQNNREDSKVIGYIAYIRLINGFEKSSYWSLSEIETHGKKFSQSFKKGFGLWKDDFDSMAKKTVLKLLLSKYAPMSVDIQTAINSDQAVISEDDNFIYADNISDQNNKAVEVLSEAFQKIETQKTEIEKTELEETELEEIELEEIELEKMEYELDFIQKAKNPDYKNNF